MTGNTAQNTALKIVDLAQAPVEQGLSAMAPKFDDALPHHIPAQRFVRTALSACANKDIRDVAGTPSGRKSIYDACLKAAADGLLLDGREAALVKFGAIAQYMPMVAGLMKKARNSGEIASIVAQVVYSNDEFEINYVTADAPVTHKPNLVDRGAVIGAYAVARLKDGTWTQPEFMSIAQVEKVRSRSRAKDAGPWKTDWEEMARKTVIRRASKYWPSSTDRDGVAFEDVVRRDDDMEPLSAVAVDVTPPPTGKRRGAARQLLENGADTQEPAHDETTGEIIEEENPDL